MKNENAEIIKSLIIIHNLILLENSLTPSRKINNYFSNLVNIVKKRHLGDSIILKNLNIVKITKSFRDLSSLAEFEMELFWAKKILKSFGKLHAWFVLKNFWYYSNYQKLTEFEYNLLENKNINFEKSEEVVFVGGGPLPLTAIQLYIQYGIKSIVLDSNVQAVKISKNLIKKLGFSKFIEVKNVKGEEYKNYKKTKIVFVASLAGVEENKKINLLDYIGQNILKDSLVLVRSATGLRTLLYTPVNMKKVTNLKPILHIDPEEEIINCVYICKKK